MIGGPRGTTSGLLGLCFVAGLLTTQTASAQTSQPLHDERTAKQVDVEKVATLEFQNLDVAPNILTRVFRLPNGGWGATASIFRGTVPLFSASGSPTGTLGRPGPGPGEFKQPAWAMAVGSQLWVVDPGNNRITAFGSNGKMIDDRTLPGRVFGVQPRADGRGLLLSGYFGTSHAVARVTMSAADDQFGGELASSQNFYLDEQLAAETPSGDVWSVAASGGRVEILSADSLKVLAWTHLPEDLSHPEARVLWDYAKDPPAPLVWGIMTDSGGTLWIVLSVADAHWRPGLKAPADAEKMGDTLILAVRPQDRTIVGVKRMDRLCRAIDGGLISCTNESATTVDILRVSLEH